MLRSRVCASARPLPFHSTPKKKTRCICNVRNLNRACVKPRSFPSFSPICLQIPRGGPWAAFHASVRSQAWTALMVRRCKRKTQPDVLQTNCEMRRRRIYASGVSLPGALFPNALVHFSRRARARATRVFRPVSVARARRSFLRHDALSRGIFSPKSRVPFDRWILRCSRRTSERLSWRPRGAPPLGAAAAGDQRLALSQVPEKEAEVEEEGYGPRIRAHKGLPARAHRDARRGCLALGRPGGRGAETAQGRGRLSTKRFVRSNRGSRIADRGSRATSEVADDIRFIGFSVAATVELWL